MEIKKKVRKYRRRKRKKNNEKVKQKIFKNRDFKKFFKLNEL